VDSGGNYPGVCPQGMRKAKGKKLSEYSISLPVFQYSTSRMQTWELVENQPGRSKKLAVLCGRTRRWLKHTAQSVTLHRSLLKERLALAYNVFVL
jgi:hypothetical protein